VGICDTNSDPGTLSHPIPGNDDAVKSIRIIVETIMGAVQSGLAQRDSRRAARGAAAELKAAQAAGAESVAEIDLSKIELPADVAAVVEGEENAGAPKKKAIRPKKTPVKAE
jgi:small subunit ribosomal protein S2